MDESVFHIYSLELIDKQDDSYLIRITRQNLSCQIRYNPIDKVLEFIDSNLLSSELSLNIYQLRKILHNKRNDTFFPGFKLKFVLRNNETAIHLNDLSKLVVLDRRNGKHLVTSIEKNDYKILKIYTDGCYLEKRKCGAYIALIKSVDGLLNMNCKPTSEKSSSLIELLAVIEGIKFAGSFSQARIVSDSRYIIKGLTEWIFNWKLNNWYTAQGKKVKNIIYWKEFERLTRDKYIEFEWVKAHSMHYENSICDYYAKQAALRQNPDKST